MPELPDIEVFSYNLKKRFAGKRLAKINVVLGKKLKDKPEDLSRALEGQVLKDVYRAGKEFRFLFSNKVVLGMHLMLTGDIIPFEGKNERKSTIVEFHFDDGTAFALTDRMKNANIQLNPVDKKGVDVMSKDFNFKYLKSVFQRKTNVKSILIDQDIIRGIGNGYSDEILWQTRISPFSVASAIPDEKINELISATKEILTTATEKIMKSHPDLIYGEVKDYQEIHRRTESPTGYKIHMDEKGSRKTYYTDEQVLYE